MESPTPCLVPSAHGLHNDACVRFIVNAGRLRQSRRALGLKVEAGWRCSLAMRLVQPDMEVEIEGRWRRSALFGRYRQPDRGVGG